ncbi:hypothetical protein V1477_017882 [Vespula maculifrons]|uniref:Uncharacterized protein n=1 Tax=Vespula maculifrons TaxID=7453 RepID=A0ABD2AZM1_VESMC
MLRTKRVTRLRRQRGRRRRGGGALVVLQRVTDLSTDHSPECVMFDAAVVLYAEATKSDNSSNSGTRKKLHIVPSINIRNISNPPSITVKKFLVPIKAIVAVICAVICTTVFVRIKSLAHLALRSFTFIPFLFILPTA